MEKKVLIFSIIVITALCVFSTYFFINSEKYLKAYSDEKNEEISLLEYVKPSEILLQEDKSKFNLKINFPSDVDISDIKSEEDYIDKSFLFSVNGMEANYFKDFPIIGDNKVVQDILYIGNKKSCKIKIKFSKTMCTRYEVDGRCIYFNFFEPKELYDKMVVIDPFGGGDDLGIVFDNIYEKDINLSIAKKVKEKLNDENIGVFLTRVDDSYRSIEDRAEFANGLGADIYVVIGQNSTSSGRESEKNGTEVLYLSSDKDGESKSLANTLLESVCEALSSNNLGIAAGDEHIIFQKVNMTCAIIRVGYMTNRSELENIKDDAYQNKCAQGICNALVGSM